MRNISIERYDTRGACFKLSSDHVKSIEFIHLNEIIFIYFSMIYLIMIFVIKVLKQNYYMKEVLFVRMVSVLLIYLQEE